MTKDITIFDNGTVVGFRGRSTAGQEFLTEEIETEAWQWFGGTLWVDHRPAQVLLLLLISHGLEVSEG